MPSHKGKCHCGHVQWTVTFDRAPEHILWYVPRSLVLSSSLTHLLTASLSSHCDTCKQLSGSTYTLNSIIPKDNLKINKGTLNVYAYKGDSGNPVHCYYCPNCTTHVYHHQTVMGDKVIARTGLLQGASGFKPAAEIYGKAKWTWEPKITQTFELLPPS